MNILNVALICRLQSVFFCVNLRITCLYYSRVFAFIRGRKSPTAHETDQQIG